MPRKVETSTPSSSAVSLALSSAFLRAGLAGAGERSASRLAPASGSVSRRGSTTARSDTTFGRSRLGRGGGLVAAAGAGCAVLAATDSGSAISRRSSDRSASGVIGRSAIKMTEANAASERILPSRASSASVSRRDVVAAIAAAAQFRPGLGAASRARPCVITSGGSMGVPFGSISRTMHRAPVPSGSTKDGKSSSMPIR